MFHGKSHVLRLCTKNPSYTYTVIQPIIFSRIYTLSEAQSLSFSSNKISFCRTFLECSNQNSLLIGKQAHGHMIVSGFIPTVFVHNCLMKMYVKCSCMKEAQKAFDKMTERDTVSYNTMVFGYAGCGEMGTAKNIFDRMPKRDVVSWNSMISGFLQNSEFAMCIDVFIEMGRSMVEFDRTTLAIVLNVCAVSKACDVAIQIHSLLIRVGFYRDAFPGSALVDMYSKCKRLDDSLLVFYEISDKNWVSWSAIIAGCVQNDRHEDGLGLFKEAQNEGVGISQSIYASVLRSCAGFFALKCGSQLHCHALKNDFGSDIIVGTATLDMYAKCGCVEDAQKQFNSMPKRGLQSYNAIIVGYARNSCCLQALREFHHLMNSGLGFNEISLSGVLGACASMRGYLEGIQVHGIVAKSSLKDITCVANAVLDMYGKCGVLVEARNMFDEMERRDAVSWNAVIAAHEQNGSKKEMFSLFESMLHSGMKPDEFTYGSILKACSDQQDLTSCMQIHNRIIKCGIDSELFVGGVLVDVYCKCGTMEEAEIIHERIKEEEVVSWNAIISGFSLQRKGEDAQRCFSEMLKMGLKPDNFTYAAVVDTCANLATIGLGRQIHAQVIKLKLLSDTYICSTLVDMYSKCGNMQDSKLAFEKALKRDFVTWNAMICGYSQHGRGEEALETFKKMVLENVSPNHATFISILRVCAHMGLVDQGLHHFYAMRSAYNLDPQPEHYSCMVDMIGRSGRVGDAMKLIQDMPFEADAIIWRTLLSICKMHGNVDVAEKAARELVQLDPQDASAYILISNIYADAGMWDRVSQMRTIMRQAKLKKEPGCSWIEVKDAMHMFLAGDNAHSKSKELYNSLGLLIGELRQVACAPSVKLDDPHE